MKQVNLFKNEWLNEQVKNGNIELKDLGYVDIVINHKLVGVDNIKSWKSKFFRILKREGFSYDYFKEAYFSQKIRYEWSLKKWNQVKKTEYKNDGKTTMQQMQSA